MDIDSIGVVKSAVVLGNADDLVALVHHQLRCIRSHVAEALDDDAAAVALYVEMLERFIAYDADAPSRGLAPPARPADVQRLSCNYGGDSLAHVHGIGIHDPRHHLLVGVDVRRGNILLRADELDQLCRVAARHPLQLADRHFFRIADHTTLGTAEGNVHHRALPGHPAGQRAHFIQRDIGRVADTTLRRPARDGVLDAVAGEDFDGTVVHADREVHDKLACWIPQNLPESVVQVQL